MQTMTDRHMTKRAKKQIDKMTDANDMDTNTVGSMKLRLKFCKKLRADNKNKFPEDIQKDHSQICFALTGR